VVEVDGPKGGIGMTVVAAAPRGRREDRRLRTLVLILLAPAVALVFTSVVVPTLIALADSFQHEGRWTVANYASFVVEAPYLRVMSNTLVIALIVTGLCIALSAPAAAFLAAQDQRAAAILLGLLAASLWISVLVRIYSWQVLLARVGPINQMLQALGFTAEPVPFLYTRGAVVVSMVQFLIPYATMMMYAGMRRVDWELVTAARTLGASLTTVSIQIYWPQVRFAVTSAALVVFMIATSFFVSPAILGGPRDIMIGMQMHSDLVNRYESGMAATTGVILTAILLVVAWIALRAGGTSFRRLATALDR